MTSLGYIARVCLQRRTAKYTHTKELLSEHFSFSFHKIEGQEHGIQFGKHISFLFSLHVCFCVFHICVLHVFECMWYMGMIIHVEA